MDPPRQVEGYSVQRPADTGNTIDGAITVPPPEGRAWRRRQRWAVHTCARTYRWGSVAPAATVVDR